MTTKEKILKSALKLFTKYGIDKTSTAKISKDVGIAEGTLFVHFKTKQELIDSLYISIKVNSFGSLGEKINDKDSTEKNIKRLSKHLIEYFISHPREFVFIGLVEGDPQISKRALKTVKDTYKDVGLAIYKWQKQGDLKNVDMELLGNVLWSVVSSIIKYCRANKVKKVSRVHLDLVWQAVRK